MKLFEQIETIATSQNMVAVLSRLEAIRLAGGERDYLDVLVLGQFKAGKSSFINHLLSNDLLPTGVLPVTAIITRISYGIEPEAGVNHFDGSHQPVAINRLSEFISESENPENNKEVSVVDVFLPAMKLLHPVRLVDTPGLGSIFAHNNEVTRNWMGRIKAAVVVISAVQPLSENDVKLIAEAVEQSPKVYILLSKTDLVATDELDQISAFIKTKLQSTFSHDFELFPYSINGSGNELKQRILDKIFISLAKTSKEVQQEVYHHKLHFLAKKAISYLEINLIVLQRKEEERKQLESQIIDETLNLKYLKQELNQIGNSYKATTRDLLKKLLLEKHTGKLSRELSDSLVRDFDTWNGNLAKVTRQYEKWIRETMVTTIKRVELDEWDSIAGHPKEAYNHFSSYLKNFRERLNQNIKKILNIDMPKGQIEINVSPLQSPPVHISRTFDSHIDMLWFIVPMPIFRKHFKKHFLSEIPHEIEKNSYRLIAQLTDNINRIIDEMQQQAVSYVSHELESLATAITRHQTDKSDIKQMIEALTTALKTKTD